MQIRNLFFHVWMYITVDHSEKELTHRMALCKHGIASAVDGGRRMEYAWNDTETM